MSAPLTPQQEVEQLEKQVGTPATAGLSTLLEYSRQPLFVGRPPHFVFDAEGRPADRPLVELSTQLRIAAALEEQNKPLVAYDNIGPYGHKLCLQVEPDGKTLSVSLACPDDESALVAFDAMRTALAPLFDQEGGHNA